jgi:hypothetical protein
MGCPDPCFLAKEQLMLEYSWDRVWSAHYIYTISVKRVLSIPLFFPQKLFYLAIERCKDKNKIS